MKVVSGGSTLVMTENGYAFVERGMNKEWCKNIFGKVTAKRGDSIIVIDKEAKTIEQHDEMKKRFKPAYATMQIFEGDAGKREVTVKLYMGEIWHGGTKLFFQLRDLQEEGQSKLVIWLC
eukprot:929310-Lingulodinium_polyedra.AAC.1